MREQADGYEATVQQRITIAKWQVNPADPFPDLVLYMDASVYGVRRHGYGSRYWLVNTKSGVVWEGNSLTVAMREASKAAKALANPREFTVTGQVAANRGPEGRSYIISGNWPVPKAWTQGQRVEIIVRRVD